MARFRNLVEDAKKYLGVPPYPKDVDNSEDFLEDCERTYGKEAFHEMVFSMRENIATPTNT
jgi:phenylalanyl-tRNA synthetase beta subunit